MSISEMVTNRGIMRLYHFTPIENFISILERGYILSRSKVDELKLLDDGFFTADYVDHMDEKRLDSLRNYINLSLSRPNWYLLKEFQQRSEQNPRDWCILSLDISPMLNGTALFSVCNAASATAKRYGVSGGSAAFERMFMQEIVTPKGIFTRKEIPRHYTTDIQAEVLIKDSISTEYIKEAFLPNQTKLNQYKAAFNLMGLNSSVLTVNQELFLGPKLK